MTSLSYFFLLQTKRMHRTIRDWGVNPWLVYIGAPILFAGGSIALFSRTAYASWIYLGIAAAVLLQLCSSIRLRFLGQVFKRPTYWRIRMIENMLAITPFVVFLLCRGDVWLVLGLLVFAAAMLPLRMSSAGMRALPTPFSRYPFEFAVGFRNSVGILFIAYMLMIIGMYVGNGYLSIATLVLAIFVCSNYYAWSEPLLYVWVYRLAPGSFLWLKVKVAFRYLAIVLFPMALGIACFFPEDGFIVLTVSIVGYGYLALAVLAKYAAFPAGVSVPQGFFMVLSFVFPPLLLVSLPYFFRQAKNNIALIL